MSSSLPLLLLLLATAQCGKDKPVFSPEIQEIIDTVHGDCVAKTGAQEDTLLWENTATLSYFILKQNCLLPPTGFHEDIQNCEKGIFKEDEKLKCYMVCLLEEASLVDDDQVDYDMLISLMPEALQDRTRTMLFACKHLDTMDKNSCQRAFDVHKCSYEKDADLYFLL